MWFCNRFVTGFCVESFLGVDIGRRGWGFKGLGSKALEFKGLQILSTPGLEFYCLGLRVDLGFRL